MLQRNANPRHLDVTSDQGNEPTRSRFSIMTSASVLLGGRVDERHDLIRTKRRRNFLWH
jgi:hypothetical protein